MLTISLLHFLLKREGWSISEEASANPDNRNKNLVCDDIESGKIPLPVGPVLANFDLKNLPQA